MTKVFVVWHFHHVAQHCRASTCHAATRPRAMRFSMLTTSCNCRTLSCPAPRPFKWCWSSQSRGPDDFSLERIHQGDAGSTKVVHVAGRHSQAVNQGNCGSLFVYRMRPVRRHQARPDLRTNFIRAPRKDAIGPRNRFFAVPTKTQYPGGAVCGSRPCHDSGIPAWGGSPRRQKFSAPRRGRLLLTFVVHLVVRPVAGP